MKRSTIGWLVIAALLLVLVFTAVGSYNRLVSSETAVDNKAAQIDTQLQRREDVIPNLVNTVKGYAAHEKEVFQAIADARSKLAGAGTTAEKAAANTELEGALSRLLVVVENYPNLKADAQFTRLMDELSGTENRIAVARQDYNNSVTDYNTKIRKFPAALYASIFGFEKKDLFKAAPGAETVPEVQF
ncbi:LemA family protein [Cohnella cholangitidis]|uniref:LemA family protein n=1 Tax=Cohnella cholangitidis TaxID=2598458 RepID=A0A7G5C1M8_9BACL|nr:LemA family protein [Cohnella cholangitidis]QMV43112.1 LemA family protein [Cohnella cholangitidis]